jgi:hypothetical protein
VTDARTLLGGPIRIAFRGCWFFSGFSCGDWSEGDWLPIFLTYNWLILGLRFTWYVGPIRKNFDPFVTPPRHILQFNSKDY